MIPDEAVEAAARAFYQNQTGMEWESRSEVLKETLRGDARAALEAAAPHLMAAAVGRVRSNNDHIEPGSGAYSSGFHYALDCVWTEDDV